MLAELSIIGIIIAVIVAIVASFLKRKQADEEWELPPELKPKREQPPQTPARNWEEELRRVLEERPNVPPPIIRREPPPPPLPRPEEYEPHMELELPRPQAHIEPVFQTFDGLTESTERIGAAASLQQRVQEHFHEITTHRVGTTSVRHAELSPELRSFLTSLHHAKGARTAVLASVILGPPRALESH